MDWYACDRDRTHADTPAHYYLALIIETHLVKLLLSFDGSWVMDLDALL